MRATLVITALSGSYTGSDGVTRNYTSGAIQTKGLFQARYGTHGRCGGAACRLEARIEIPQGQGLWPAFWAVGSDTDSVGWPQCGEIDMMENLGNDPFTIYGSIHGPQSGVANGYGITTAKHRRVSLAGEFHVYGVTWSPNKLVFTLDGVAYATYTPKLALSDPAVGVQQALLLDPEPRGRRGLAGIAERDHDVSGEDAGRLGTRLQLTPILGGTAGVVVGRAVLRIIRARSSSPPPGRSRRCQGPSTRWRPNAGRIARPAR